MHAGLIPIVSYESSVDIDVDFGITLKTSSVEEIKDSVQRIANLPAEELKRMARRAWEFARANHTQERFAEEYRKAIELLLCSKMSHTDDECLPERSIIRPSGKGKG
jgi:glycosyltransferase involved in cell wall biosynthesis